MPPSPRLSARRMRTAYLSEMMTIRAQMMSETTPRTAFCTNEPVAFAALTASRKA